MTHDAELLALLRSALPPVVAARPARDVWPLVVQRTRERQKWSWFDVALAAGAVGVLLIRRDVLLLLAYCF